MTVPKLARRSKPSAIGMTFDPAAVIGDGPPLAEAQYPSPTEKTQSPTVSLPAPPGRTSVTEEKAVHARTEIAQSETAPAAEHVELAMLTIRLPKDLRRDLAVYAKMNDTSVQKIVHDLIDQWRSSRS